MGRNSKRSSMLDKHSIFGDEEAAQLQQDLDDVRSLVAELSDRVYAQFTTIAAHAEIAREHVELARAEARSDLERTRETLIGLLEQVRSERPSSVAIHVPGSPPGPSIKAQAESAEQIETRLRALAEDVERCVKRQSELADTMAAFLDTMLSEQSSASALTVR
jgi:hypothetical protein